MNFVDVTPMDYVMIEPMANDHKQNRTTPFQQGCKSCGPGEPIAVFVFVLCVLGQQEYSELFATLLMRIGEIGLTCTEHHKGNKLIHMTNMLNIFS